MGSVQTGLSLDRGYYFVRCLLTHKSTADTVLWQNAHMKCIGLSMSGFSVPGSTVTLKRDPI